MEKLRYHRMESLWMRHCYKKDVSVSSGCCNKIP